jgi:hypothetical protein
MDQNMKSGCELLVPTYDHKVPRQGKEAICVLSVTATEIAKHKEIS